MKSHGVRVTLIGLSLALGAAALVFYGSANAAGPQLPSSVLGDLNRDGQVGLDDLAAFVLALEDPQAWQAQYGGDYADLLARGDFDQDGAVTVADRVGFAGALADADGGGGMPMQMEMMSLEAEAGGETEDDIPGVIDLDIDSDNTNGLAYPDRTTAEDTIEDVAGRSGKFVPANELARVPLVLEIMPYNALGALTCRNYRLGIPANVKVYGESYCGQTTAQGFELSNGTAYGARLWVRGDMNGDGVCNFADIDPFVLAIQNWDNDEQSYMATIGNALVALYPDMAPRMRDIGDFTGDRRIKFADVDRFAAAIAAAKTFVPVYFAVEGLAPSSGLGVSQIVAEADTSGDGQIGTGDAAADAVRATVEATLGAPPAWGAGLPVSPFSVVNLQNGNVLTAITLTSWDPVGPPVSFTLYHNSTIPDGGTDHSAWGFDLGDGWSVSYGAHIVGSAGDDWVVVVSDDGSRDVFTQDATIATRYNPPAGVHDLLDWVAIGSSGQWELTSPGQSKLIFDDAGKLTTIEDSSGNAVVVERDGSGRLLNVKSAADPLALAMQPPKTNRLSFTYNSNGLWKVTDVVSRVWEFVYETSSPHRLYRINYPAVGVQGSSQASYVEFQYASGSSRIASVRSRDAKTWAYTYVSSGTGNDSRLAQVQDPGVVVNQQTVNYTQTFDYEFVAPDQATTTPYLPWQTTYVDRRNSSWILAFDGSENLRQATDPLSHTETQTFDARHNLTASTNALNKTWTYTYDTADNLLTTSSPLTGANAQTWTVTWERPDPTGRPNFYRLTGASDPLNYTITYDYEDPSDPTLVTSVTEPADGGDNGEATTVIEYYGTTPDKSRGQLKMVTDANGVQHKYEYDALGYVVVTSEGDFTEDTSIYPGCHDTPRDAAGRLTGNGNRDSSLSGPNETYVNNTDINYNANDQPTESDGTEWCDVQIVEDGPGAGSVKRLGRYPSALLAGASYSQWEGWVTKRSYTDVLGRAHALKRNMSFYAYDLSQNAETVRTRELNWGDYDGLGRPRSFQAVTGGHMESDPDTEWSEARSFTLEYNATGVTRIARGNEGPTQPAVVYTYDELGRPKTITREGTGQPGVEYFYDAAGRLERIDNKTGGTVVSKAVRHYDDADRLEWVEHRTAADVVLLRVSYEWNRDNTVATRTEYDATGQTPHTAVVTFGYDARKRLTSEARVVDQTQVVYDLEYTYDQLGNRKTKTDNVNYHLTTYTYDVDPNSGQDPDFRTHNNRLIKYEEYGPVGESGRPLLRTVKYTYYATGHVSNIAVKDNWYTGAPGSQSDYAYTWDLGLSYDVQGQLFRAVWDKWQYTAPAPPEHPEHGTFSDYKALYRRDFMYDSPTQLYGVESFEENSGHWVPDGLGRWTEYVGGQPMGDYELTQTLNSQGGWHYVASGPDETQQYLSGAGVHAQRNLDELNSPTRYLHGDLTRSTMLLTDAAGGAASAVCAYTAFGELVNPNAELDTRFQYDGGWGYESGLLAVAGPNTNLAPIMLQHVGARWYQPGIGRFVQRDPIGIEGGMNCYLYCGAHPSATCDPDGTMSMAPPGFPGLPPLGDLTPFDAVYRWLSPAPGVTGFLQIPRLLWNTPLGRMPPYATACVVVFVTTYQVSRWVDQQHPGTSQPYTDYLGNWLGRGFIWVTGYGGDRGYRGY